MTDVVTPAFLRELNAAKLNPRVKYSLLLGSHALVADQQLAELRQQWMLAQREHRVLRALGPRFGEYLRDVDELVEGKGDGVVAVSRGRLPGVEDTTVLEFDHFDLTDDFGGPDKSLVEAVIQRLAK